MPKLGHMVNAINQEGHMLGAALRGQCRYMCWTHNCGGVGVIFFLKKSGNQGKNIIDLKILCLKKKKEKKSCRDNSGSIETFSDVGEGLLKLFFLFFGE